MKNYVRLYWSLLVAILIGISVQAPRGVYAQCTNRVVDSNFEAGSPWTGWPVRSSVFFGDPGPLCNASCGPTRPPRDGANWAWFGAISGNTGDTQTLGQNVSIPSVPVGVTTLFFYLKISDSTPPLTDTFTVKIDGTTVASFPEPSNPDGSYILRSVNVSAFANGASHALLFTYIKPTGGGLSNYLLDGIFLGSCPTASASAITGRLTGNDGSAVEGATVRLSGNQSRLTVTDTDGNYRFENVDPNGFYTVTPSRANFSFSPGERSFSVLGSNTEATFSASQSGSGVNPLDTPEYFVRQQYLDFLGREPDEAGLNFWTNNILSCGNHTSCMAAKRVDTSAAFFLSTEFEQTGFLVYRTYQSAFGDMPGAPVPVTRSEFKPDAARLGSGVVVNQDGWRDTLDNNKRAYLEEFVQRARFVSAYPATMTPAEFVDRLFTNAGVIPALEDRNAAIGEFGLAGTTSDVSARGRALLRVAENSALAQQERNQAFVAMQYLGYLGRDANGLPDNDYSGFNFWLNKLNSFNGDFRAAEMVRAFVVSGEYRGRFHQ
jgi:hypothetical protein